jgi:hypothetical protein
MKKLSLTLTGIAMFAVTVLPAQKNKKAVSKTTITITKEENGHRTTIDTTFIDGDHQSIEAFLRNQKILKPDVPPVPPAPPVPPGADFSSIPPIPPIPQLEFPDESFNSFENGLNREQLQEQMEQLKNSLENVKEELKNSMENININKEELKEMLKELNKEPDQEKDSKSARKKSGYYFKFDNGDSYSYKYHTGKDPVAYSYNYADAGNPPFIISTYKDKKVKCNPVIKERSKARKLIDKIVTKILD